VNFDIPDNKQKAEKNNGLPFADSMGCSVKRARNGVVASSSRIAKQQHYKGLLGGCTNNIVYRFLMLRILITSYTKLGLFCI